MIRPSTLSARLTWWYVSAFTFFLGLAFGLFYLILSSSLMATVDEDLTEDVAEFRQMLDEEGMQGLALEIERESKEEGEAETSFIRFFNNEGRQLLATDLSLWPEAKSSDIDFPQVTLDKQYLYTYENETLDIPVRAMVGLITPDLYIHAAESLEETEELLESIQVILLLVLLVAIPATAFVGWRMAKRAVSGISQVSRIAQSIEPGELNQRVSGEMWGEEIEQLAETFNAMLDRIAGLVYEMRDLTDNVAHDLRSPITRIRIISETLLTANYSDNNLKDSAADIIDECDRLIKMINTTLDLAELEAGAVKLPKAKLNLMGLVNDALELFQPLAEEKGIKLTFDQPKDCFIVGDKQSLQRMLANLIDNAVKYTNRDGEIKLSLAADNGTINLHVMDNGIGIKDEEQSKVFERFYRCDKSRLKKGCGLGLSFAAAVARAHGGEIQLSSTPGHGSDFIISLRSTP